MAALLFQLHLKIVFNWFILSKYRAESIGLDYVVSNKLWVLYRYSIELQQGIYYTFYREK